MDNLARKVIQDSLGYEILNGELVNMSPASSGHTAVISNIHGAMYVYFRGKRCRAYVDGMMIHFSERDKVVPDLLVVCKPEEIKPDGVHGAPELAVEVLSPSTAFRDKGYKKNLYEKNGVREYWIVDTKGRAVEVYRLDNGRYLLDQLYVQHSPEELALLSEEEKRALPEQVQSCTFPGLSIPLGEIFEHV